MKYYINKRREGLAPPVLHLKSNNKIPHAVKHIRKSL